MPSSSVEFEKVDQTRVPARRGLNFTIIEIVYDSPTTPGLRLAERRPPNAGKE